MIYNAKVNQLQLIIIIYLCDRYDIAYYDTTKIKSNTNMICIALHISKYITCITKEDSHTLFSTKEPHTLISFKEFINHINSYR